MPIAPSGTDMSFVTFTDVGILRKECIVVPEIRFALFPVGQRTLTAALDPKREVMDCTIERIRYVLPDPARPDIIIRSGAQEIPLLYLTDCPLLY